MNTEPYYPIGIQDFSEIRAKNAIYVDKTSLIYKLTHTSKFVFLSRPRRFGKSLLSSTLKYYFQGRKNLFTGLAMERLETEWIEYPVIQFDLSRVKSDNMEEVEDSLSFMLEKYEALYCDGKSDRSLRDRFTEIITNAYNKTGKKVVVLIDEYDAPILEVLHDDEKRESARKILRRFYSPLKACDKYLHFVFLTGISTFSQLSIFSELNNLKIISRNKEYNAICGITKQELIDNFQPGIEKMSKELKCSKEEVINRLTDSYDGYHFSQDSEGIFNPFSLLNAFDTSSLGNYWFAYGTPAFLVEMLGKYKQQGEFKIENLEADKPMAPEAFETPIEMQSGPIPLLYQAGYLTISGYNKNTGNYNLGIPNSEVRVGLIQNLIPLYSEVDKNDMKSTASEVSAALRDGDIDQAMLQFKSILESIPFMRGDKDILADEEKTEAYYHRIFYFFFRMLNNEVYAEIRSAKGAADITIRTPKYMYIVEIKINSSADAALRQIEEKGYAVPYLNGPRQVRKLGINFSTETRTVTDWKEATD
jgi:hypothetical protein